MDTISENRTRHAREVERIQSNGDLSPEAKRRKVAALTEKAHEEHARLVEKQRQERMEAIEQAERKLLGISYPERASAHEKAIIAMSCRDARDRAERAAGDRANTDALAELLERAEVSGDALLAERYVELRREADSFGGLLSAAMSPRVWARERVRAGMTVGGGCGVSARTSGDFWPWPCARRTTSTRRGGGIGS